MRTYSASQFKTHALAIMEAVDKTGESIMVTKRGKPLVRVEPAEPKNKKLVLGTLRGTMTDETDIVSPMGAEMWYAAREDSPKYAKSSRRSKR